MKVGAFIAVAKQAMRPPSLTPGEPSPLHGLGHGDGGWRAPGGEHLLDRVRRFLDFFVSGFPGLTPTHAPPLA